MTINVLSILNDTTVDGPGFRTSIYCSGCKHHCEGCHNPESWNMKGGEERTLDELMEVIKYNEAPVTFSGGDPLAQPKPLAALARRIKQEAGLNVWCYTGYTWEHIKESPELMEVMKNIDVLVDRPFLLSQRDTKLRFRGSANQRLIDVPKTLATGLVTLWQD